MVAIGTTAFGHRGREALENHGVDPDVAAAIAPQDKGEVGVRLIRSGINPGDTSKRADWVGNGMQFPRIIPDSDAASALAPVWCAEATARRS